MIAMTFDTHEAFKEMRDAGIPEAQAEAIMRVIRKAYQREIPASLVTADLKIDIAEFKADFIKWFAFLMLVQTAFIVTIIKLMS
jgi:hypothetical protein